jgi:hypothetical protein
MFLPEQTFPWPKFACPTSFAMRPSPIRQELRAEKTRACEWRASEWAVGEIESERRWDELSSRPESADLLASMADDALAEAEAGQCRPLSLDDL